MLRPSQQWAAQIDICNLCHLACSNCTRMLNHAKRRFFMSPDEFESACRSLATFPTDSEPCPQGRRKVVGIIGGEPLLHPEFPTLVDIITHEIPDVTVRGLWTSKDWKNGSHPKWGAYRPHVERLIGTRPTGNVKKAQNGCGYLNWNMHTDKENSHHQPVLVSISDVIKDEKRKWELIADCWVQREWSSSVTHKGFFFCEVAAAFDVVMHGPGGLPLIDRVWDGELAFKENADGVLEPTGPFAEQIKRWCGNCGACLPLPGRRDNEEIDDVSPSNLVQLEAVDSPRVKKGDVEVHNDFEEYDEEKHREGGWSPYKYMRK